MTSTSRLLDSGADLVPEGRAARDPEGPDEDGGTGGSCSRWRASSASRSRPSPPTWWRGHYLELERARRRRQVPDGPVLDGRAARHGHGRGHRPRPGAGPDRAGRHRLLGEHDRRRRRLDRALLRRAGHRRVLRCLPSGGSVPDAGDPRRWCAAWARSPTRCSTATWPSGRGRRSGRRDRCCASASRSSCSSNGAGRAAMAVSVVVAETMAPRCSPRGSHGSVRGSGGTPPKPSRC